MKTSCPRLGSACKIHACHLVFKITWILGSPGRRLKLFSSPLLRSRPLHSTAFWTPLLRCLKETSSSTCPNGLHDLLHLHLVLPPPVSPHLSKWRHRPFRYISQRSRNYPPASFPLHSQTIHHSVSAILLVKILQGPLSISVSRSPLSSSCHHLSPGSLQQTSDWSSCILLPSSILPPTCSLSALLKTQIWPLHYY